MTPSGPVAAESNRIKVWFRFVPREDWLPYDTEGLWATRLSADTARVENIPFLQNGVAEGEAVRFVTDADGLRWSKERVEASGNCTIRVLPVPSGPLGRSARAVHERLSPFGLGGEVFSMILRGTPALQGREESHPRPGAVKRRSSLCHRSGGRCQCLLVACGHEDRDAGEAPADA
ncbi:DUF4265 domain-containing protein [Kitasatospora sp. NPDC053057]|uniref:DUF4265 domain-containing protein n=1 Tax=Kitasatospora sp. NPDC053057 TaxID=3364062 RepID=UPI0037C8BB6E